MIQEHGEPLYEPWCIMHRMRVQLVSLLVAVFGIIGCGSPETTHPVLNEVSLFEINNNRGALLGSFHQATGKPIKLAGYWAREKHDTPRKEVPGTYFHVLEADGKPLTEEVRFEDVFVVDVYRQPVKRPENVSVKVPVTIDCYEEPTYVGMPDEWSQKDVQAAGPFKMKSQLVVFKIDGVVLESWER
jgi:hypothetical protein